MTVGSRSTKMARGTLCPDPVSLKNVELESDDVAAVWPPPSTDSPSEVVQKTTDLGILIPILTKLGAA